jgi:phage terminase small subunit
LGRNAQPIDILKARGKKHLTKQEIQDRKASEIKLGEQKMVCPAYVKNDVVAYQKWKEIIKIYKDFEFVTSGDSGILARYCKTYSEYQDLVQHRQRIINFDSLDYDALEILEEQSSEEQAAKLFNKINYILSVDGVLKIDAAINKKSDMLIKYEDRIFLNPLAKVKNVPKKEKPKEKDPNAEMFD